MQPDKKPIGEFIRNIIISWAKGRLLLCQVVKYVRIVPLGDGTTEERPYELLHPVKIMDYNYKSRYRPHQGKREKERRLARLGHRINDLPKGKPVQ